MVKESFVLSVSTIVPNQFRQKIRALGSGGGHDSCACE